MVKNIDKTELVKLRRDGMSIRQIARKTGVPRSTVYVAIKDTKIVPGHRHLVLSDKWSGPNPAMGEGVFDESFLYVHLPFMLICPICGLKTARWSMCLDCGRWIPQECDCLDKPGNDGCGFVWADIKREIPSQPSAFEKRLEEAVQRYSESLKDEK
jgi:hypothetical protein